MARPTKKELEERVAELEKRLQHDKDAVEILSARMGRLAAALESVLSAPQGEARDIAKRALEEY